MAKNPPTSQADLKSDNPFAAIKAKRPAPPKVAPVTFEGVRYEQAARSEVNQGDQRTGFLAAYKVDSNERLWLVRVYEVKVIPHLERDVQEVYFAKMEVAPATREIIVENESGARFAVNVDSRAVREIK